MSDVFEPPHEPLDGDDPVRRTATRTLLGSGGSAVALAMFSWCCDPCWLVTIASVTSATNTLRLVRQMRVTLDEDFPEGAGVAAQALAAGAIVITIIGAMIRLLSIGLRLSEM